MSPHGVSQSNDEKHLTNFEAMWWSEIRRSVDLAACFEPKTGMLQDIHIARINLFSKLSSISC